MHMARAYIHSQFRYVLPSHNRIWYGNMLVDAQCHMLCCYLHNSAQPDNEEAGYARGTLGASAGRIASNLHDAGKYYYQQERVGILSHRDANIHDVTIEIATLASIEQCGVDDRCWILLFHSKDESWSSRSLLCPNLGMHLSGCAHHNVKDATPS